MRVALGTALRCEAIGVAGPSPSIASGVGADADAVVEFLTGVGLHAAACGAATIIRDRRPDAIVFFGCAGSVDAACGIGCAVVCTAVTGTIEGQTLTLEADRVLAARAVRCLSDAGGVRTGTAFSSPTFVSSKADRAAVARRGAVCVESEGIAVAIACAWAKLPWVMIRVITDDENSPPGFPSSERIAGRVQAIRPAMTAFIRQLQAAPAGARA